MSYTGTDGPAGYYELVPASTSNQVMGGNGNRGDYLEQLIIIPTTTAAGTCSIKDGANTAIPVFNTGTLADLSTIVIPFKMYSTSGAWQITTGANVTAIAVGRFT